jgi:rubrerythrin
MTDKGTTIEQILEQAIRFEEDAHSFYSGAIEMVERAHIRAALGDLAQEEVKHKERLQALLAGDTTRIIAVRKRGQIADLKLAEYLVPRPLDPKASLQDVLIVAMHRERSSHEFYSTMAEIAGEPESRALFGFLAEEELVHKNKVESLYDEVVYQDN